MQHKSYQVQYLFFSLYVLSYTRIRARAYHSISPSKHPHSVTLINQSLDYQEKTSRFTYTMLALCLHSAYTFSHFPSSLTNSPVYLEKLESLEILELLEILEPLEILSPPDPL